MGGQQKLEVGKMVVLNFKVRGVGMHQSKFWVAQVFKLAKMKGNL